jgi:serine/threonine protein kinase
MPCYARPIFDHYRFHADILRLVNRRSRCDALPRPTDACRDLGGKFLHLSHRFLNDLQSNQAERSPLYFPLLLSSFQEQAKPYFRSLLSATAFLHHNLVSHNDIKPANVLLTSTNVPVLVDFGFATVRPACLPSFSCLLADLTLACCRNGRIHRGSQTPNRSSLLSSGVRPSISRLDEREARSTMSGPQMFGVSA